MSYAVLLILMLFNSTVDLNLHYESPDMPLLSPCPPTTHWYSLWVNYIFLVQLYSKNCLHKNDSSNWLWAWELFHASCLQLLWYCLFCSWLCWHIFVYEEHIFWNEISNQSVSLRSCLFTWCLFTPVWRRNMRCLLTQTRMIFKDEISSLL